MIRARSLHLPVYARLLVVLALLATSGAVAHAQSPTDSAASRRQSQAAPSDRSASPAGIELTPDQRAKLSAISNKHAEEAKAVGELYRTDPDVAMKRMVVLRTKMQAEARAVLTSEQRAIFDRNMAELNAQMAAHRPLAPH